METNRGLHSSSSSTRSRSGASVKSKIGKTEDVFAVGTIVFLTTGVMENSVVELDGNTSSFHPIYCLQSDVDVSPVALTGMKQSGLCVMKGAGFEFLSTDTYSVIDDKLHNLFPNLFDWIIESEPYDATTSSWLICVRPPYHKSPVMYSDDQSLPTGFDIITTCQLARSKAGVQERVLYLVTRDRVPNETLKEWRPHASGKRVATLNEGFDVEDGSLDDTDDEISSAIPGSVPFPSTQPSLGLRHHQNGSEDEVEQDVISISDNEPEPAPSPVANAATPPCVNTIKDHFSSSMNFDDEENPWIS
ncbi:hypothetical protein BYT27DRAFT_6808515 [Phlegmacium glaucopus]|nr:hypothetical protein BYT27DRAFT_6808515 [Phlegmacium glaucopus]